MLFGNVEFRCVACSCVNDRNVMFSRLSGMSPFSAASDEETLINVAYSRYDAGDLQDGVSSESLRFLFKVMKRLPR